MGKRGRDHAADGMADQVHQSVGERPVKGRAEVFHLRVDGDGTGVSLRVRSVSEQVRAECPG